MEFNRIELQADFISRHCLAPGSGVSPNGEFNRIELQATCRSRSFALLVGLALLALPAACDSIPERSDDPWMQNWQLSHLETQDGSRYGNDTTPQGVSVQFNPTLLGSNGCDLFSGQYDYTDPQLTFSDVEYQYAETHPIPADCPDEAQPVADAMRSALRDGATITTLTSELMVWEADGNTIEFYPGVEG